ncbi:MAG: beta-1,3-glucanase family protein [Chlamydiae bacterium]|nr:beta-1,3-glucanase family protein [Chlamydiota bacterium]
MKKLLFSLTCFTSIFVQANDDTFSADRITTFESEFTCDEKQDLYDADLTSPCIGANTPGSGPTPFPPSPPTPPPPKNPLNPAPKKNYLPVVISNTTGLPASDVYVTLAGQQVPSNLANYFFKLGAFGVMSPVIGSSTTFSPNYSYPLNLLPRSSTGVNDYLVYVPNLDGARFYFTIRAPMYLASADGGIISGPTYYAAPSGTIPDPNFYNLFESIEATFFPHGGSSSPSQIPWTASVNTTEVDAFGLPISIAYYSYNPATPSAVTPMLQNSNALPSGFGTPFGYSGISGSPTGNTTRSEILLSITSGLSTGDLTGQTPKIWPKLEIPFYTNPYDLTGTETDLRIISPKQGIDGGVFPTDYLSGTSYGADPSFLDQLYTYYQTNTLYMSSSGAPGSAIYSGTSNGTTLTFTVFSGAGATCTLNKSDITAIQMYNGTQPMQGGADGPALGSQFGDAFTVGLLPGTIGGTSADPMVVTSAFWQTAHVNDYYAPEYIVTGSGGPWMNLYADLMHSVAVRSTVSGTNPDLSGIGLCYGYDDDDSLGMSGTITPANTTPNTSNPYLGITLGAVDTTIPDPYIDTNTYTVTFTFPAGRSLQYKQGNGSWTTVTSSQLIAGLTSNSSNPLYISYTNQQGTSQFIVYFYYTFLEPVGTYNAASTSIINSTTFTNNSSGGSTPTIFTIDLSP